jgi:hypothetical protein
MQHTVLCDGWYWRSPSITYWQKRRASGSDCIVCGEHTMSLSVSVIVAIIEAAERESACVAEQTVRYRTPYGTLVQDGTHVRREGELAEHQLKAPRVHAALQIDHGVRRHAEREVCTRH